MTNDKITTTSAQDLTTPRTERPNPAGVYLASLAFGSRRTMEQALRSIAGFATGEKDPARAASTGSPQDYPWERLRHEHTHAIRAWVSEHFRPATAGKMLAALRGVLRHAWAMELLSSEDYQRAIGFKAVKHHQEELAGRMLERSELDALFAAIDDSPIGIRDRAMLLILVGAGLREHEVAILDAADVTQDGLSVLGKGKKRRFTPLPASAAQALEVWMHIRLPGAVPLFCGMARGGRLTGERLHPQTIWDVCMKRVEQSGIKHFSPHDLRRTFASMQLDAGTDLVLVQRAMGHSNPATTARYDRRSKAKFVEAISKVDPQRKR